MIKSIYTPLSGALAQEKVLDIIANNLANVNTVGYKGESVTFKVLESEPDKNYNTPLPPANYKIDLEQLSPLVGNEVNYVGISNVVRDLSQGPAIETKNPLDLMIEGDGYFSVHTRDGIRYTRDGSFSLSVDGALVDRFGNPVLGEKGNIFVRGNDFEINSLGEVYQNGELVDRISLYKFEDDSTLEKVGNNHLFYGGDPEKIKKIDYATLRQGYLEGSNVNAIKNLTAMILAHRSYESYQKTIKNFDSMMDKSSNSIGAVRA
ncbi:MAG: flagellar hook-basal body protein [Bdellovibrionota bacterium]